MKYEIVWAEHALHRLRKRGFKKIKIQEDLVQVYSIEYRKRELQMVEA